MKKLFDFGQGLLICFVLALAVAIPAYTQTFTSKTGDNEVATRAEVVVERAENVTLRIEYTLLKIDEAIDHIDAQIADLQIERAGLVTLRALVDKEAAKVTLSN